jgi:hypothetical protein
LFQNASLAEAIVELEVRSAVLWPKLDTSCGLVDDLMTIPESLNLFVYPSLWRPLAVRHRARLLTERPDLRDEIACLPQVAGPTG